MASSVAYKRCPQAIFIRPRFDAYRAVSADIREIFFEFTSLVEPLSLDEAFLDVTENHKEISSATLIAEEIKHRIGQETGNLTASAGVSFNKFIAKVASDFNKPNGITVITPEMAEDFIDKLPIRKFFGVGKVTEEKMLNLGIHNGSDLKKFKKEDLIQLFGKSGNYFYNIAHGLDNRPVEPNRIRKSIGKETTLGEDIDDVEKMLEILENIAERLESSLIKHETKGHTITLKIKYFDFQSITRSITVDEPVDDASVIINYVRRLLSKTEAGQKKIRLLGISVSGFDDHETGIETCGQLLLPFKGFQKICYLGKMNADSANRD
jgi:DNA polymerase-4